MARRVAQQRTKAAALSQWVAPQLTQLVEAAPNGDGWLHEIKYDGYRMHARLDRGAVKLLTRTGLERNVVKFLNCDLDSGISIGVTETFRQSEAGLIQVSCGRLSCTM